MRSCEHSIPDTSVIERTCLKPNSKPTPRRNQNRLCTFSVLARLGTGGEMRTADAAVLTLLSSLLQVTRLQLLLQPIATVPAAAANRDAAAAAGAIEWHLWLQPIATAAASRDYTCKSRLAAAVCEIYRKSLPTKSSTQCSTVLTACYCSMLGSQSCEQIARQCATLRLFIHLITDSLQEPDEFSVR